MPAKGMVGVGVQIVFMFITPLNIWAFYRIKKLRKAAGFVFIPSSAFQIPEYHSMVDSMINPTAQAPYVTKSGALLSQDPRIDLI